MGAGGAVSAREASVRQPERASRALARFAQVVPLRCRGAFHTYAAHADGAPRLVIVPSPSACPRASAASVSALVAAHARVAGPAFPPLAAWSADPHAAYAAFAIDPVGDGERAIALLGEARMRVSYREAMGMVEHLGRALELAHAGCHAHGAPLALGGMGWANVLLARDGTPYLLGLGHNVVGRDEHGALSGAPSFFVPPELARGGAPTPSADAFAFIALQRSVLSYCALPAPLERIFAGRARAEDRALEAIVAFSTNQVLAAAPAERGSLTALRARWLAECALLGITPDLAGLRTTLSRLFADPWPAAPHAAAELLLGPEAAWFRAPDGTLQQLDGRGPYKRILLRLVHEHQAGAGGRLDATHLLEAGWPGQRVSRAAGLNRVYVTIASLRKMGLRLALQRDDRGYRLDPSLTVRFAPAACQQSRASSSPS